MKIQRWKFFRDGGQFGRRNLQGLVVGKSLLCSPLGRNFSATMPRQKFRVQNSGVININFEVVKEKKDL